MCLKRSLGGRGSGHPAFVLVPLGTPQNPSGSLLASSGSGSAATGRTPAGWLSCGPLCFLQPHFVVEEATALAWGTSLESTPSLEIPKTCFSSCLAYRHLYSRH